MQALGRQVLVEFYDCAEDAFADEAALRQHVRDAITASGGTIVTDVFHRFNPYGITGIVVITESHVAIHTWPEHRYVAIDIFTCGSTLDPWIIRDVLAQRLRPANTASMELQRGAIKEAGFAIPTQA
jgi:S-adenosylmethionine decarboxylase proenzyme